MPIYIYIIVYLNYKLGIKYKIINTFYIKYKVFNQN